MRSLFRTLVVSAVVAHAVPANAQTYAWVVVTFPDGTRVHDLALKRVGTNSVSPPTSDSGKTRIDVTNLEPGTPINVDVVDLHLPPRDILLVWPRHGQLFVPKTPAEQELRVCRKVACKDVLKESRGAIAVVSHALENSLPQYAGLVKEFTMDERLNAALAATAEKFGIPAADISLAARQLARQADGAFEKGVLALFGKDYPEAIRHLRESAGGAQVTERTADAALFLGQALYEQGSYAEAAAHLQRAESLFGGDDLMANARGVALFKAGRFADAAGVFSNLAGRHNQYAIFRFNLGAAFWKGNHIPEAVKAFEAAAQADSAFTSVAFIAVGDVYTSTSEVPRALAAYQRVLEDTKKSNDRQSAGVAIRRIGSLYSQTGDQQAGLAFYQEVLKEAKAANDTRTQASALAAIGIIQEQQGDVSQALNSFKSALSAAESTVSPFDPALVPYLLAYSRVLGKAGRSDEAKALELRSQEILSRQGKDRRLPQDMKAPAVRRP